MPVIFITDGSSEELVISAFKAGVRDFFKNPFNMIALIFLEKPGLTRPEKATAVVAGSATPDGAFEVTASGTTAIEVLDSTGAAEDIAIGAIAF